MNNDTKFINSQIINSIYIQWIDSVFKCEQDKKKDFSLWLEYFQKTKCKELLSWVYR